MAFLTFVFYSFLLTTAVVKAMYHDFDFSDKKHLQEHMQGELDLSFVTEGDLQFIYFQSHDSEGNNKLDGCELVQSLLHFHAEETSAHGQSSKVFTDAELSMLVDPLLAVADQNKDGYIDYPEFMTGNFMKGF